jgi:hypothetical protein
MLVHSGAAPILQEHVGSISQTYSLFKKLIGLRFDACEKKSLQSQNIYWAAAPFCFPAAVTSMERPAPKPLLRLA